MICVYSGMSIRMGSKRLAFLLLGVLCVMSEWRAKQQRGSGSAAATAHIGRLKLELDWARWTNLFYRSSQAPLCRRRAYAIQNTYVLRAAFHYDSVYSSYKPSSSLAVPSWNPATALPFPFSLLPFTSPPSSAPISAP